MSHESEAQDSDRLYELFRLIDEQGLHVELDHNCGGERTDVVVAYNDGQQIGRWSFNPADLKSGEDVLGAWLAELRNDIRRAPHRD